MVQLNRDNIGSGLPLVERVRHQRPLDHDEQAGGDGADTRQSHHRQRGAICNEAQSGNTTQFMHEIGNHWMEQFGIQDDRKALCWQLFVMHVHRRALVAQDFIGQIRWN